MSREDRAIRVPLSVDAQFRLPVGPLQLPLRSLCLAALASPLAYLLVTLHLPALWGPASAGFMLVAAASLGIPDREGVWVGTFAMYRRWWRLLPSTVSRGHASRARVRTLGGAIQVTCRREPVSGRRRLPRSVQSLATLPQVVAADRGLMRVTPGGHRAVVVLQGPAVSVWSESYLGWCGRAMSWITSLECPAQFLTVVNHHDEDRVIESFDARLSAWPRTPLYELERTLQAQVARHTLGMRHFVVFAPRLCGPDGIPMRSRLGRVSRAADATEEDARRVLGSATRMASSFGIAVEPADRDDLAGLLAHTVLGAAESVVGEDVLHIGEQHHVVLTTTQLPPSVDVGCIAEAMMRAQSRGLASLQICPVSTAVAQKHLHKRSTMLRYAIKRGADRVEAQVALEDTTAVVASLAQRDLQPVRLALTMSVSHPERARALDAAERLSGVLSGAGFRVSHASSPGFLPALALSPGGVPLGRSLLLTADSVATRMLPCLGTPFSDVRCPLVGINRLTGAPAYLSIWRQANHNLVVVGSSGAGKSVAAKTLLVRHLMEGAAAVVIDPDSEYRPVMQATGGEYFELGRDSLNPFAVGLRGSADEAASLVLPILSVMGGDEKGIRDGRPIRRLPDEDQGWLHSELVTFYRHWSARSPHAEPVMHDVVDHLATQSAARALTPHEAERCRVITARLRRFTQGIRADVFDRPSTFAVRRRAVAIGLRAFAMTYGADLTPALAVVLTSILAAVQRGAPRLLVVVDEAHRITSDPDAGEVLGQLVRQARKHGAGVWMMSQRVEDFVGTDLGRTLASTAACKLVLGTEEAVRDDVRDVFKLRDEETAAICPMTQGRGVLVAGAERTVVDILPGMAIMALADTSAASRFPAGAGSASATIP